MSTTPGTSATLLNNIMMMFSPLFVELSHVSIMVRNRIFLGGSFVFLTIAGPHYQNLCEFLSS